MKKIFNFVLIICILFIPFTIVSGEDGLGSITLHGVSSDGVVFEGQQWSIYLVGERVDDETISLIRDFADYPVDFGDMSSSALGSAAKILKQYAEIDGISPLEAGQMDASGTLLFDALDTGIYLLSAETLIVGNVAYLPYAFFVEINLDNSDGKDLNVYPKYETNWVSGGGTSGGGSEQPPESEVLLPETGGIGNWLFYCFGSVMMICSLILYIRIKKDNCMVKN